MLGLRVKYFFANFIYKTGNFILQVFKGILFNGRLDYNAKNILIFRTGNLGDTFCTIPTIRAIKKRFPDSRLIFMTAEKIPNLPHPIEVLNGLIKVDEIFTYDPSSLKNLKYISNFRNRLKNKRIDLVVYLGQSSVSLFRYIRDLFFFKLGGCRSVCGFQWTKHRIFPLAQRNYRRFDKEVERLMKLLTPLGVYSEVSWEITEVPLSFNWPTTAVLDSRPVVAIHPTAKFPVKQWPFERFIEVVRVLREKYNAFIVVVGAEEAEKEGKLISETLEKDVLNLAGKTTFLELAEVLRRCDFLISNDSGPIHVAAAVRTPVVGIYSARDYPECWYPWGEIHRVIRKDMDCQICLKTECTTMDCIKNISVKEVLQASDEILEEVKKR
jgi:ADP-heptose:LPS heptosyltransferase